MSRPPQMEGLVVANLGRHVLVQSADGQERICHPRGKKNDAVVGDRVLWQATGDEGSVEKILPRASVLYRQDELRTKTFAANIDMVLVWLAAEPEFSESQLSRALIAASEQGIEVTIVLNKQDLPEQFDHSWQRLEAYRQMGYNVLPMSLQGLPPAQIADAPQDSDQSPKPSTQQGLLDQSPSLVPLLERLVGKATLVLGPSGTGKSTLINALVPGAAQHTQIISQALNSGKHTTTRSTWHWVDKATQTALIDSPGFQSFGLHHIDAAKLAHYMPDMAEQAPHCKFYNCTHLHEPACAARAQLGQPLAEGGISDSRYRIYNEIMAELTAPPVY